MSKPSEWLPKTNKLFERWCFASPTPREILESFNELETELADKDKQLVEALEMLSDLKFLQEGTVLANAALKSQLAEARAEIERKDKLIEQMREALKALRKYPNTYIATEQGYGIAENDLAMCDAALAAERTEK